MTSSLPRRAVRPAKVLIVEDEYLVAMVLEGRLLDAGFDVIGIAATGKQAYQLAASERPEIALMDIRLLGNMDGVEAAIELLAQFGIRSIFTSAHADVETRKRAAAARPLGWVQKPYVADHVIDLLNKALS